MIQYGVEMKSASWSLIFLIIVHMVELDEY